MNIFPTQRSTHLPGGYMGKILRVDLTTGTLHDENLPEEFILKKFIGGQALASYILLKELSLNATPFGPENMVVMMTGPLTGNGFTPGGTKMTAVYLSPLTNTTLGRGATSGYWATHLKAAGYDGIILNGLRQSLFMSTSMKARPSCVTPRVSGASVPAPPKIVCAKRWDTGRRKSCASAPPART
jgi:hypothetical protein